MDVMLACASHSPLIYFPAKETEQTRSCRAAIDAERARVQAFDPELVVVFGTDHYGGQSMSSMPPFCVGTQATSLADVGGFAGTLRVDEGLAERLVDALRADDVDVAVSYAMEVDHGFSQVLHEFCGGVEAYPVLPVFVNCIAPPFVPFRRVAALGRAVGRFVRDLDISRVLLLGTGGVSHDPAFLFPAIHDVPEPWLPYHLLGTKQDEVSRQTWIDYEIAAHLGGAQMLADAAAAGVPPSQFSLIQEFDDRFLDIVTRGDLEALDSWVPDEVVAEAGIGAMEVLSWVAANHAARELGVVHPEVRYHELIIEIGVGFAILEGRS